MNDAALTLYGEGEQPGYLMQYEPKEEIIHECYAASCSSHVRQGGASRMSVGFRHVSRELGESYIQIHQDQQTCSHDCAREAVHARIEQHRSLSFGVYDREKLNPDDAWADSIVKSLAEYSPISTAWANLPKRCAVETCQNPLTKEMYVVHLDYSRPAGANPGMPYMEVIRVAYQLRGIDEAIDSYYLAGCCLDHALAIAHMIVDVILEHVPRDDTRQLEGIHRAIALPEEVARFQQLKEAQTVPLIEAVKPVKQKGG